MTKHLEIILHDDNGVDPPRRLCIIPNLVDGDNIYVRLSSFNDGDDDDHRYENLPPRDAIVDAIFDSVMSSPITHSPQVVDADDGDDAQPPLNKQISFFRRSDVPLNFEDSLHDFERRCALAAFGIEEDDESEKMRPTHGGVDGFFPGESSTPPTVFCKICMEPTSIYDSFSSHGCSHVFCIDCISQHIAAKVSENCKVVQCPEVECNSVLDFDFCKQFIPQEVHERWGKILCEASIDAIIIYCPFKNCLAPMLDEGREVKNGVMVPYAMCPHCDREICVYCKCPWHTGISCSEYQKLGTDETAKEELMFSKLAKKQVWGKCTKCGYYVERTEGCSYMVCRCKFRFCYFCGVERTEHKYYCHACKK